MRICVKLTAVVGGRAALSFSHDRAAALKRWGARKRNAPYGAHRAETIVACGLPLDVANHLALDVSALADATSWTIMCRENARRGNSGSLRNFFRRSRRNYHVRTSEYSRSEYPDVMSINPDFWSFVSAEKKAEIWYRIVHYSGIQILNENITICKILIVELILTGSNFDPFNFESSACGNIIYRIFLLSLEIILFVE